MQKYNALISKNIQNGEAIGVPLTITRDRINELIELGCLESSRSRGDRMILLARSPTGQEYQFEAIPQSNNHNHYRIEIAGKPIYVLSEPEIQEFFVPDYDLLLVATHFRDFGAFDNIYSAAKHLIPKSKIFDTIKKHTKVSYLILIFCTMPKIKC